MKLNQSCRPLLQGKERIALRQDATEKPALRKASSTKRNQSQNELWEALRACRANLAKEQGVPPYVIFHDSTLMEMVEQQPATRDQFAQLSGVGEAKLTKYAEAFLTVIAHYQQRVTEGLSNTVLASTVLKSLALLENGLSVEEVAQQRQLSPSTIYSHASQLILNNQLSLKAVLDLDDQVIKTIEDSLIDHDVTSEQAKLKPVYEALGEAYSYNVLRCVMMNFIRNLSGKV